MGQILKLAPYLGLLAIVGCLTGCKAVTGNSGEWSVAFSQGIVLKSVAAKTTDVEAYAGLWPTPLTDYVIDLDSDGDGKADTSAPVAAPAKPDGK